MRIIISSNLINYVEIGDRENKTLVLLHGWLDNLSSFKKVTETLSKSYHLVSLDLPGFGESTLGNDGANLDLYVNVVKEFIHKLNLKPYAFVGHSFGGRILIKGCGEHVLKSEKLVLIGSAGISEKKSFKVVLLGVLSKIFKLMLDLPLIRSCKDKIRRRFYTYIGSDYLESEYLSNIFQSVISEDLQKYAGKITIPTLLLYGEKDRVTPVAYGQIFHKLILNSVLTIIPGGTHIVHKDLPERVSSEILTFLE